MKARNKKGVASGANRKLGVMDVVAGSGPDAVAAVDKLGYEFLASHGYEEAVKCTDCSTQDVIRKKMSKRGERLFCHGHFDGEKGVYSVWFTLRRGNKRILATSKAVRLQGVAIDAPVAYDEENDV